MYEEMLAEDFWKQSVRGYSDHHHHIYLTVTRKAQTDW